MGAVSTTSQPTPTPARPLAGPQRASVVSPQQQQPVMIVLQAPLCPKKEKLQRKINRKINRLERKLTRAGAVIPPKTNSGFFMPATVASTSSSCPSRCSPASSSSTTYIPATQLKAMPTTTAIHPLLLVPKASLTKEQKKYQKKIRRMSEKLDRLGARLQTLTKPVLTTLQPVPQQPQQQARTVQLQQRPILAHQVVAYPVVTSAVTAPAHMAPIARYSPTPSQSSSSTAVYAVPTSPTAVAATTKLNIRGSQAPHPRTSGSQPLPPIPVNAEPVPVEEFPPPYSA
ncbi:hypothetical protein HDU97_007376 [Phlyctochytrium planicorne]|nr:hypothetical protein HDU97_007376 [Phlyctochytrium planicorne]